MVGYIFDANKGETPAMLAKQRAIAEAMLASSTNNTPRNVGEGLATLGRALSGRWAMQDVMKREAAGQAHAADAFGGLINAGTFPSAPSASPSSAATPVADAGSGGLTNYRDAIAGIESAGSGDYSAIGPTNSKLGRALGRYQVMEANIAPWSKEALGREVTPQEFLADPKLQDAIFDHKFGSYVQKFGNPQDAASAWFTGQPLSKGANRKDVLGTTGAGYVDQFNRALGSNQVATTEAAPSAAQVASLDPSAGMQSPDPYGRIPATDSRGEDQRAKFRQWNSNPIANEASNEAAIDPALAGVIDRAKQIAGTNFVIGSGRRDAAMQQKAVGWGWSKTNDSDHLGGGAADLWPVDGNGQVVFDPQKQATIVQAMKQAAQEKGVDLEAGADWSRFKDTPHFGMVGQTPLDNAPVPTARPDPNQVASIGPSASVPPSPVPGVDVGAPGAVTPAGQRVLSTMMSPEPIGGQGAVVQALSAANAPAPAPAAPSPVVQALAGATQPQQAAAASPGVQKVAQAMTPQDANLPVMAGGSSDAVQPGQGGPSMQQLMMAAGDPWVAAQYGPSLEMLMQQRVRQADPAYALDIQTKQANLALDRKKLGGNFMGDSMDAQAWNILQTADPSSREYATAYSIISQPKTQLVQTANGMVPIQVPPQLPGWVKAPGDTGGPAVAPAGAGAGVGGVSPASAGSTAPQGAGVTPGAAIPGTKQPATEMQARNGAIGHILLNEVPTLGKTFSALSDTKGQLLSATLGKYGNPWQSEEYQRAAASVKTSVANVLYSLSGASSNPDEVVKQIEVLTPAIGDKPGTIADKLNRFKTYVRAVSSEANDPELTKSVEAAISQMDAPEPNATAGTPKAGTVEDGYRFKGGDPADKNNWEPAQ